jgi:diadenosine tetraphosphate (Ap4A) HIT family hydrolase
MAFSVNNQLAKDSVLVCELALSQLRLMNNQHYPWLILIPRVAHVTEIIDLDAQQQQTLLAEINLVAKCLKSHFPCDKLNIANLGNVVSQLHIHIIARRQDDISWPKPVWGGPTAPYADSDLQTLVRGLQALLQRE